MFLPANKVLMLADVHLGKAAHFRKGGLAVPEHIPASDLNRLSEAIALAGEVEEVCFLGDLFHSHANSEWQLFEDWMMLYPNIRFTLISGNHDRHSAHYLPSGLVAVEYMELGPLLLTHEPSANYKNLFNLHGHWHPAVNLEGKGRQRLKLPCFYFGSNNGVLPAFGEFNSHATLPIEKAKAIFVTAPNKVWRVR